MRIPCLFCLAIAALAQSRLDRPRLGMILDSAGRATPVYGVAGSVTLGDPVESGVLTLGCSRELCLMKTRTAIVSSGQVMRAPVGPALFAFAGHTALVYFPMLRKLARWHGGRIEPVAIDITGEVLSLRVRATGEIEFAVRRNHGTWIVNERDQSIDSIPSDSGPVMLLEGGFLYASSSEAILRRDDASEIHFGIEQTDSFSAMNDEYVQVRSRRSIYAIRTTHGRERILLLPEPLLPEPTP